MVVEVALDFADCPIGYSVLLSFAGGVVPVACRMDLVARMNAGWRVCASTSDQVATKEGKVDLSLRSMLGVRAICESHPRYRRLIRRIEEFGGAGCTSRLYSLIGLTNTMSFRDKLDHHLFNVSFLSQLFDAELYDEI